MTENNHCNIKNIAILLFAVTSIGLSRQGFIGCILFIEKRFANWNRAD
jgi:hypothetical protein